MPETNVIDQIHPEETAPVIKDVSQISEETIQEFTGGKGEEKEAE